MTTGTRRTARRAPPTTASVVSRRSEHADLDRIDPDVGRRRPRPGPTITSGGTGWIAVTPTVFWAVIAVIAVVPWTPSAANAFRSAWIPAPPPESEPAIERTTGVSRPASDDPSAIRPISRAAPGRSASTGPRHRRRHSRRARAGARAISTAVRTRDRRPPRSHRPLQRRASTPASTARPVRRHAADPSAAISSRTGPEQQVEHVLRVADHRRALGEQLVRAARAPRGDRAGDGADLPAALDRHLGGDQRPGALRRLDDHGHARPSPPSAGCAPETSSGTSASPAAAPRRPPRSSGSARTGCAPERG